jgi:hypothetical protein
VHAYNSPGLPGGGVLVKGWKEFEKNVATWLSRDGTLAVRKAVTWQGIHIENNEYEDIEWGAFSVECKSRQTIPKYIHDWLHQAHHNSNGRIPVVVWHQDHMYLGTEIVLMRLIDFYELAKKENIEYYSRPA